MSTTPQTLTNDEANRLLETLLYLGGTQTKALQALRNYTMAILMLDAGLRVGEVVALKVVDLIIGQEPVNALHIRPEITKTKTARTILLSERIRKAIPRMRRDW